MTADVLRDSVAHEPARQRDAELAHVRPALAGFLAQASRDDPPEVVVTRCKFGDRRRRLLDDAEHDRPVFGFTERGTSSDGLVEHDTEGPHIDTMVDVVGAQGLL